MSEDMNKEIDYNDWSKEKSIQKRKTPLTVALPMVVSMLAPTAKEASNFRPHEDAQRDNQNTLDITSLDPSENDYLRSVINAVSEPGDDSPPWSRRSPHLEGPKPNENVKEIVRNIDVVIQTNGSTENPDTIGTFGDLLDQNPQLEDEAETIEANIQFFLDAGLPAVLLNPENLELVIMSPNIESAADSIDGDTNFIVRLKNGVETPDNITHSKGSTFFFSSEGQSVYLPMDFVSGLTNQFFESQGIDLDSNPQNTEMVFTGDENYILVSVDHQGQAIIDTQKFLQGFLEDGLSQEESLNQATIMVPDIGISSETNVEIRQEGDTSVLITSTPENQGEETRYELSTNENGIRLVSNEINQSKNSPAFSFDQYRGESWSGENAVNLDEIAYYNNVDSNAIDGSIVIERNDGSTETFTINNNGSHDFVSINTDRREVTGVNVTGTIVGIVGVTELDGIRLENPVTGEQIINPDTGLPFEGTEYENFRLVDVRMKVLINGNEKDVYVSIIANDQLFARNDGGSPDNLIPIDEVVERLEPGLKTTFEFEVAGESLDNYSSFIVPRIETALDDLPPYYGEYYSTIALNQEYRDELLSLENNTSTDPIYLGIAQRVTFLGN